MKICVIYPDACSKSAKELAEALGCKAINPYQIRCNVRDWDFVFNYGCAYLGHAYENVINKADVVNRCIDKLTTFNLLAKAGVPIPKYSTSPKEAAKWDIVVCRKSFSGHGNEGMSYWYKGTKELPKGVLFTKHFEHICEYRIVVFKDKVVGRYRKDELEEGSWNLTLMQKKGFEDVDRSCLQAARALQIDYVGFDVLENKKGEFVVLEANSGPILTEESKKAIVKYFKKLKLKE